ncbi:hypothetical protein EWM64_g7233 [Hericium alpestre]|uniref:Macro-like domain-containing protein n=1 Tax=Hericium alpestre TaxID=135208 RepID=A0A4Y9ZTF7_9AGAM|nr:hypothetical protein EWM64_g7233 [Hericium alpestre]
MDDLSFVLLDLSPMLIDAWQCTFTQHVPEAIRGKFTIVQSMLENLVTPHDHFDCIVLPANSYGKLDGGFDYFLLEALALPDDKDAPTRIAQSTLYTQWKGYMPPGTCTLVLLANTPCADNLHACTFIVLCPTMHVPMIVTWNREVVYNCMWTLLNALDRHNTSTASEGGGEGRRIRMVLMTGLAMGSGCMLEEHCMQQMALVVHDFAEAAADPEKWSSLSWADMKRYAANGRRTYGNKILV